MKTADNLIFTVLVSVILLCSNYSFSQKDIRNLKSGIKEIESSYAQHYSKPDKITFAFTGNPKYGNNYYSNLKEHLFKVFTQKGIPVSFINGTTDEPTFILKVDNAKVIHENDGHNKEIRYELEGTLTKNDASISDLSFKIVVNTIHDINQQNKKSSGVFMAEGCGVLVMYFFFDGIIVAPTPQSQ